MSLVPGLISALPHGKLTSSGDVSRFVFEVDGCWLDARIRQYPVVEVYVRTLAIPGFRLRIRPTGTFPVETRFDPDLGYDPVALAAELEARGRELSASNLDVDDSDDELRALWLDGPAIDAAIDALWLRVDRGLALARIAVTGYDLHVADGAVLVRRTDEDDVDRLARAVHAGAVLAARPHRIARAWHEVARALGGTTTTDRWDLGGAFAALVDRGPTTVRVDNLLEDGRLRTRLSARVPGAVDEAALRRHDVRLDGYTLVTTWPGLVLDRERLGAAVDVLAALAAPRGATGPYR